MRLARRYTAAIALMDTNMDTLNGSPNDWQNPGVSTGKTRYEHA